MNNTKEAKELNPNQDLKINAGLMHMWKKAGLRVTGFKATKKGHNEIWSGEFKTKNAILSMSVNKYGNVFYHAGNKSVNIGRLDKQKEIIDWMKAIIRNAPWAESVNEARQSRVGEVAKKGRWEVYDSKTDKTIKIVKNAAAATRLMNRLMDSGGYDDISAKWIGDKKDESANEGEGPGRELPPQKYVVYIGFGRERKIVKKGLSYDNALKLHNKIEKLGKHDDYGMDNHRDWNDKNGKQIKEYVNEDGRAIMKSISNAKKGAIATGGGYSPFVKMGKNAWKQKKTNTKSHDDGIFDKIGMFKDFMIDEKIERGNEVHAETKKELKAAIAKSMREILDGKVPKYDIINGMTGEMIAWKDGKEYIWQPSSIPYAERELK